MGVVYRLREAGRAKAQLEGERVYKETVLGQAGYIDRGGSSSESSRRESDREFRQWIGERYRERQVGGQVVSKGIAVVVVAILQEEAERGRGRERKRQREKEAERERGRKRKRQREEEAEKGRGRERKRQREEEAERGRGRERKK
jgi:hypothetical protein